MCIDNVVARPEPCDTNGIFYTEISFDHYNPASDSFFIRGNWQNYGQFAYGQSTYRIGPIEANPNLQYEFVIVDAADPNCNNFTEIGSVSCNETETGCKIYGLWADTGGCQTDGTQSLYFGFYQENVDTNGFIVQIDNQFQTYFPYDPLADSIGYFLADLNLSRGEHELTICNESDITCCKTIRFLAPNCNENNNECRIFDIETTTTDCKPDGTVDVRLNFEHESLNGDFFTVLLNERDYDTFRLAQLPIDLENLMLFPDSNILSICVYQSTTVDTDDNFECCTDIILEAPICDSTDCKISNLFASTSGCRDDGLFDLYVDFQHQNINTAGFHVFIDDWFYDSIPFLADSGYIFPNLDLAAGQHVLTICGTEQPNCCQRVEFLVPECTDTNDCRVFNIEAEASECKPNGLHDVFIDFEYDALTGDVFEVIIGGERYDSFLLSQLPLTITNVALRPAIDYVGICVYQSTTPLTTDVFRCCTRQEIRVPDCGINNCLMDSLYYDISDCATDGTVDITVLFDTELDNDSGFNVFIDERYMETYGYHQIPFVLNKIDLPAGRHQLSICRNDVEDCCMTQEIFLPECGTCAITNVTAIATDCENEDYFYVDLKFEVAHPSADKFRVVGNSQLYGIFEYGQDSYQLGPLDGDGATMYEFIVQDLKNESCASFAELEKVIDCEQGFVWPGDANFDNITNHFDLLNIGLAFGKIGPDRIPTNPDSSDIAAGYEIAWEAKEATDWEFRLPNGLNAKHADCNGDGIIDESDIRAIEENYFFSHGEEKPKVFSEGTPNDPALYVDFPALADIELGRETKVPIIFGSEDIPATAYGLAFTLEFDPRLLLDGRIELIESWLGTPNENLLTINKNISSDGLIEVALTRKAGSNPFGVGPIGNFIVIIDDIEGFTSDNTIVIQKVQAVDKEGNLLAVHTPKTVLSSLTDTENAGDETDIDITVYPNPAKDVITINYPLQSAIQRIDIRSISGRLIQSVTPADMENIDISALTNGVYILELQTGGTTVYRKLVKQ